MIVEISIIRESFLTCNLTLKSNLHMIECVENLIPADPIGSMVIFDPNAYVSMFRQKGQETHACACG